MNDQTRFISWSCRTAFCCFQLLVLPVNQIHADHLLPPQTASPQVDSDSGICDRFTHCRNERMKLVQRAQFWFKHILRVPRPPAPPPPRCRQSGVWAGVCSGEFFGCSSWCRRCRRRDGCCCGTTCVSSGQTSSVNISHTPDTRTASLLENRPRGAGSEPAPNHLELRQHIFVYRDHVTSFLSYLCVSSGVQLGDRKWRRPSRSPGRHRAARPCASSCVSAGHRRTASLYRTPCTRTAAPRCAAARARWGQRARWSLWSSRGSGRAAPQCVSSGGPPDHRGSWSACRTASTGSGSQRCGSPGGTAGRWASRTSCCTGRTGTCGRCVCAGGYEAGSPLETQTFKHMFNVLWEKETHIMDVCQYGSGSPRNVFITSVQSAQHRNKKQGLDAGLIRCI